MNYSERLEKAFARVPELKAILKFEEAAGFCARADEGFRSDREYFELIVLLFNSLHRLNELRELLGDVLLGAHRGLVEDFDRTTEQLETGVEVLGEFTDILRQVYESRKKRSAGSGNQPRILRLAERLELSGTELDIIHYLAAATFDPVFSKHTVTQPELDDVLEFLQLTPENLVSMMTGENKLLREGLVEIEREQFSGPLHRDLSVNIAAVKALWGLPLTVEDFLKIEDTVLAEILKAEPGFDLVEAKPGRGDSPEGDEGRRGYPGGDEEEDEDEDDDDDDDEEEDDDDLDALLSELGGDGADLGSHIHRLIDADTSPKSTGPAGGEDDPETRMGPYRNDLDYLEDCFEWVINHWRLRKAELDVDVQIADRNRDSVVRELRAKEKMLQNRSAHRLEATRRAGKWLPRLEVLSRARGYDRFEKNVILILLVARLSPDQEMTRELSRRLDVRDLLTLFSDNLEQMVANRKYFYRSGRLIRDGVISVDTDYIELEESSVEVDRRMMDYLIGLDTEFSELVEGGHLYTPRQDLGQVILPPEQKELAIRAARNFPVFLRARKNLGFDEIIPYGNALVMLFYGPSGTGKTMLGNALAGHLNRKILLVNYPSLGGGNSDEVIRFIFREAKINDAIVFFDECEGIFQERESGNPGLSLLLTEFERHDGLIIMATNKPQALDEAMHRRITLAIPFHRPDYKLRKQIWKVHLPEKIALDRNIDLDYLAYHYELTGGLIKNAVLTALSLAVDRNPREIKLRQEDLEEGSRLQLKGHLRMAGLEKHVIPTAGLQSLILPEDRMKVLGDIVNSEKSKKVLFGQWGFQEEKTRYSSGISILFHGPSGTGKTFAAEALGFELGRPVRRVNTAQVVSKWVGETAKNLDGIFEEARKNDSILLFDEADALFAGRTGVESSTDRYANLDVNILLQAMDSFEGVVILTTNLLDNIDTAFFRRIGHIVEFPVPDRKAREKLWRLLIPEKTPREEKIDFRRLAEKYPLTGGRIKKAVLRAAERAALRKRNRQLTQRDLEEAARRETSARASRIIGFSPAE